MSRAFFPDSPPSKKSMSGKLWAWWTNATGSPPRVLTANQPNWNARAAGTPIFHLQADGIFSTRGFLIHDPDAVLKMTMDDIDRQIRVVNYRGRHIDVDLA